MPKISLLKLKNILKKTNKCSSLKFDFHEVSGQKKCKKIYYENVQHWCCASDSHKG